MEASRRNRERHAALYQALRREANERKRALVGDQPVEFGCECADPRCQELVSLRKDEYEYIRRVPTRLVVRVGHVDARSERVIMEEPGRFQVLEKFGPGEDVVAHLDPRRRGWPDPRD